MTAPVMKPAGSCGDGFGSGAPANAAALNPINPIVQTTFEY
jgi:hypothetical protein